MKSLFYRCWWVLGFVTAISCPAFSADVVKEELTGLWESRRILGPANSGPLLIQATSGGFVAEFSGHRVAVSVDENTRTFAIPNGCRFEGEVNSHGDIRGHWIQPPSMFDGNVFATPVFLKRAGGMWRGEVKPQPDIATFYLLLGAEGETVTAELINPERNLGIFTKLTRVVRDDSDALSFYGRFRGRGDERVMLQGQYHKQEEIIALRYRGRGGNYDFRRVEPEDAHGFLARPPGAQVLSGPPADLKDGWSTTSMVDVGIDQAVIREMIETEILPEPTSTHDLSIHSVLIARHGKLVLEEYFHGFHGNLPHDSRSASKSVTSILAAAVMQSGSDLTWDIPVYESFGQDDVLTRDPKRRDIRLHHLVNMNTGLDCDDRNPNSAAYEDFLWDNADDLDFYEHTLGVDVVNAPGTVAAYCSASAHLAGGVIEASTDGSLLQLLDEFVARPLDIQYYSVPVPPDGHPFMGGGIRWLPRDFLKFPQMILDGGRWNQRQIISKKDAKRLITPAVKIDGGRDFGYLWWTTDYPFHDRTVRAHFMGGNGGQIAMLVPELDLSVVFNAGNYSDRVAFTIQEEVIPKFILTAIKR